GPKPTFTCREMAMIQQQVREDLKAALVSVLSPGESLINMVDAYTERWEQVWAPAPLNRWMDAFQGFNWFSIALTNINFRSFAFRVEKHSTVLFKTERSVVPELMNMSAVPLMNVSSCGSRTFKPVKVVQKALKKSLGTDPGEVLAINVQFPNGYLDCASPYSG